MQETQEERRLESKRMEIEKAIELVGRDGSSLFAGTTENFSDEGIGARFEGVPEMDSEVLLRIFWDTEKAPIEQAARVVWSDEDNSGHARVGLKVGPCGTVAEPASSSASEAGSVTSETTAESPLYLELGRPVLMNSGGVAIETVVSEISDVSENNTVNVVLRITDSAFLDPETAMAGDEPLAEEQDWTPHPFRDAWAVIVHYAGPVWAFLARWTIRAWTPVSSALGAMWKRMPASVRVKGQAAVKTVGQKVKLFFDKISFKSLKINKK